MLSLIAQASTNAMVKATVSRVTRAVVTQDSMVQTVVSWQIVQTLETVVETEFVRRKRKTGTSLAGKHLS